MFNETFEQLKQDVDDFFYGISDRPFEILIGDHGGSHKLCSVDVEVEDSEITNYDEINTALGAYIVVKRAMHYGLDFGDEELAERLGLDNIPQEFIDFAKEYIGDSENDIAGDLNMKFIFEDEPSF